MKKVLIVITDGESQDASSLPNVVLEADAKKIVRFAIGVRSFYFIWLSVTTVSMS